MSQLQERSYCAHCHKEIQKMSGLGVWLHVMGQMARCDTRATPTDERHYSISASL